MTDVKQAKLVTILSAICNALMGLIKVATGYLGHSHSLVVDGFHSITDLFTDLFVYWGAHIGSLPADENHPYGHQRIETMVMILVSLLIISIGILFAHEGIIHFSKQKSPVSIYVIIIAMLSIIINEFLFYYTSYVGKKICSSLILSNAYHHRSDSLSSIVVLIGAIGSYNNIFWLDSFAAIIVSFMIMKLGLTLIIEGTNELVDTAIDAESSNQILNIILEHPEISRINSFKTRMMAKRILIDTALEVNNNITVNEAMLIKKQIISRLMQHNKLIQYISINILEGNRNESTVMLPLDYKSKILNLVRKKALIDVDVNQLYINPQDKHIDVFVTKNAQSKEYKVIQARNMKTKIHLFISDD